MNHIIKDGGVTLLPASGNGAAPLIVIVGSDDEMLDALSTGIGGTSSIAAIQIEHWDDDLTPWPAPGLKRGTEFGGRADATLSELLECLPQWEREIGAAPSGRFIAGYSLGGLFALWACTRSACFDGCASVSGSLWYDGFTDYLTDNLPNVKKCYISLGDAEPKARSPRLSRVGDATQTAYELISANGINSKFEWNQGNHFNAPEQRMLKAVRYLID